MGDVADVHTQAVVQRFGAESDVFVLDAATFLEGPVSISRNDFYLDGVRVRPTSGWLRRLAPPGWTEAMGQEGVSAAERSAAMSALAAVVRDERISWLTTVDSLGAAENKPFQYRRAQAAGVPVPEWVVTTDPDRVPSDGEWVAKPLGPGSFIDEDHTTWVVPTTSVDLTDRVTITAVPFVLQRQIAAVAHARVVTVRGAVWSSTLPADGLALDWRLEADGHFGFTETPAPLHVHEFALSAAASVGVGFSAQDWICGTDGQWWFVDLNPAGQWLFLPGSVAGPVTDAIVDFLKEDT